MKKIALIAAIALTAASCVSKKQYAELEAKQRNTQDLLNTATVKLNSCLEEKAGLTARANSLESQVASLNATNGDLIQQIGEFTTLTKQGAANLEKSLESLKEKDLTIRKLRDAVTRRDSVNLALVQSLKGVLGNLDDEDIEVSVEKGVVYVNISDKLLFSSGSYNITARAKEVLGKVATVVNNKPDFEFLVEGHTDDVPIATAAIKDNWDLSVKRATAITRVLQDKYGVQPSRLIAAGRSSYVPLAPNDTPANKSKNRRTKIIILPKIGQFFDLLEQKAE